MEIRNVIANDVSQICEIYRHYVLNSHATFELEPVDELEMATRIRDLLDGGFPYLVAEDKGEILGYANSHQFRPRPAYKHSTEVSVYVKNGFEGRGVANGLYGSLISRVVDSGFRAVLAVIALPNDASVSLHEKFGFEKVGHLREVGYKFDRWIDVGYWQLSSKMTGHE